MMVSAAFIKQVSGTSLKTASFAFYKSKKGGYTLRPKRGKTSAKDPVAVRLNKVLAETPAIGRHIGYVYSSKSRVIRGTENLLAVRLNSGVKGWVTPKGGFLSEQDAIYTLRSLDYTTVGFGSDLSLEQVYLDASPQQRARIAEILTDVDWDEFWKEYYPKDDGRPSYDRQADMYDEIVSRISKVVG